MGSGKSSVGKRLANRLGIQFLDMDVLIEDYAQASIPEIFEESGEETFRALETRILDRLLNEGPAVIATGGGAPCHSDNMDKMMDNGLCIYLELSPFKIVRRLRNAKGIRPLVLGKNGQELESFVKEHIQERRPFYERAQMTIDADRVKASILDSIVMEYNRVSERQTR